jgi:hypothetical protein
VSWNMNLEKQQGLGFRWLQFQCQRTKVSLKVPRTSPFDINRLYYCTKGTMAQ